MSNPHEVIEVEEANSPAPRQPAEGRVPHSSIPDSSVISRPGKWSHWEREEAWELQSQGHRRNSGEGDSPDESGNNVGDRVFHSESLSY